jgi:hypothetical protein
MLNTVTLNARKTTGIIDRLTIIGKFLRPSGA